MTLGSALALRNFGEDRTSVVLVGDIVHCTCLCAQLFSALLCPWNSSAKNTGVGCHWPLPGDLPNPGTEPMSLCLLHWQVDSLPLVPPGKLTRQHC